jgi:membrane AbrB-like protein
LIAALGLGGLGGALFNALGLPLPWLLGALAATTSASLLGAPLAVPNALRQPMIALLGVMLGGAFTPERLAGAAAWLPSLAALPFYVVTVGALILLYLRRMSDFDRPTAFFAATPGGMSEMIALSDQLGGDQRRVSLVHGTRLLFIVFSIPFLARAFGSNPAAAPRSLAVAEIDAPAFALLALAGVLGWLFAKRVRLPAATFVGPLLGSTLVHLAGLIATEPPYLLLAVAQLVIGSSVGARFSGTPLGLVLRALGLGAGATLLMLLITFAFGGVLSELTGQSLALLLLAFIPGGFAEMSLIALGMGVDPAFVVTHHSLRVFLVVLIALPVYAWLERRGWMAERTEPAD